MVTKVPLTRGQRVAAGMLATGAVSFLVAGVMAAAPATADKGGSSAAPPGNNATIKINNVPFDGGVNNEPHVTCPFQLSLYNFDKGAGVSNSATVVFEAQPPSGHGEVLPPTLNPTTFNFTGPDTTANYSFAQSVLKPLTLQPNQGYHVKVTVSVSTTGAAHPGNGNGNGNAKSKQTVKHKVFWLTCRQDVTPQPTESTPTNTPSSSTPVIQPTQGQQTQPATVVSPTVSPSVLPTKSSRTLPPAKVKAVKVTKLPFTGISSRTLGIYIPAAIGFLLTGAGLVALGRNRRQGAHL